MRERPIEQGWRRGLRLAAAALRLHRLLGRELSPGEQRLLPFVRPHIRPLRDAETQVLNSLVTRRHQVMAMLVSEKNRLSAATTVAARPRIEAHIAGLERELDDLGRGSAEDSPSESRVAREGRPPAHRPRRGRTALPHPPGLPAGVGHSGPPAGRHLMSFTHLLT